MVGLRTGQTDMETGVIPPPAAVIRSTIPGSVEISVLVVRAESPPIVVLVAAGASKTEPINGISAESVHDQCIPIRFTTDHE